MDSDGETRRREALQQAFGESSGDEDDDAGAAGFLLASVRSPRFCFLTPISRYSHLIWFCLRSYFLAGKRVFKTHMGIDRRDKGPLDLSRISLRRSPVRTSIRDRTR